MNPKRKQRMILVVFLLLGFASVIGLAMYALTENINLFYNPTQIASGEAPVDARIRAGGMVLENSVSRDDETLAVSFTLTDYQSNVVVRYQGILPDLFREGQGIVALGKMDSKGVLIADEVLAKHDENYMPPEVADALEKSGYSIKDNNDKRDKSGNGAYYPQNKDTP
ncbi:MAG: cytochrome c maturation protein CcmE [Oleiphilus sp.]|nr:MAG: cytochrome c maturation protein CcmE [Oleiphilus sp.]